MWVRSENSEPIMPPEVEYSGDYVIVRKGFALIQATDEFPAHYEYDEWQMTKEQYEIYVAMNTAQPVSEQALMARYASV